MFFYYIIRKSVDLQKYYTRLQKKIQKYRKIKLSLGLAAILFFFCVKPSGNRTLMSINWAFLFAIDIQHIKFVVNRLLKSQKPVKIHSLF